MKTQGGTVARSAGVVRQMEPPLDQGAIAQVAYSYWEARGCQNGSSEQDWSRAEAELRNRLAGAATGSGSADT